MKINTKAFIMGIFIMSIACTLSLPSLAQSLNGMYKEAYSKGVVIKVLGEVKAENSLAGPETGSYVTQSIEVRLTDAPYTDKVVNIQNTTSKGPGSTGTYYLSAGDRVVVLVNTDDSGNIVEAYIQDFARDRLLYGIVALFSVIIVIFGGRRGLASLVSLSSIGILIWFWLIPHIKSGGNPVIGATVVCSAVTLITIPMVHGFNIKSFSSIAGTVIGVAIAGIIGCMSASIGKITGIEVEYMTLLNSIPREVPFDLRGIFLAGVLIGSLGAVMDTCISVASAIQEFYELHPGIESKKLWKIGMNVGRDVMSMMSSTLILAYSGTALSLLLLLSVFSPSPDKFLNSDLLVSEIIRMLSGSIGLILAIPVTILVAIRLVRMTNKKEALSGE